MNRRLACTALLGLALAACDAEVKTPAQGDEKVAMSADASGNVSFDMPFAKGDLKLPAGMIASGDFDIDGVKMVPGSKMTGFRLNANQGNQATVDMTFTAPTPPAEVSRYFLDQFKAKGVKAAANGDTIQGTTRDGGTFLMRLAPQGSGTNGSIQLTTRR